MVSIVDQQLAISRVWAPRQYDSSREGFGIEDDDFSRKYHSPESRRLDELIERPFLFLLGEPAMGKSTTIKAEVERLQEKLCDDDWVQFVNLAEISSDYALDSELSLNSLGFESYNGILHLFLDSFDECQLRYHNLTSRLIGKLSNLPSNRVRLRIASRDGEIQADLPSRIRESVFSSDCSDEHVTDVYTLQKLSRSQIHQWAISFGVDPQCFLSAVDQQRAHPFAARPMTLTAMLQQFAHGSFPASEVDLFSLLCQAYCNEPNPDRQDQPRLVPEQRFLVAERIAAATILSNKNTISLDSNVPAADAVPISSIVGGEDAANGTSVVVDRQALLDVLSGTSLFAVYGHGLVRWSQEVFREFLAASYFKRRLSKSVKAIEFLEQSGPLGAEGRFIAPQLAETAAWLAAMDDDVARWIASNDPGLFLRTRHLVRPVIRRKLTEWWLLEEAKGFRYGGRWGRMRETSDLYHDELTDQLQDVLSNPAVSQDAKSLACEFAGSGELDALEELLIGIAADSSNSPDLRASAVHSISQMDGTLDRTRLVDALADLSGVDSATHHLRAQSMALLWPELLSTANALDMLKQHKAGYADEYSSAFEYHMLDNLHEEVLIDAVNWVSSQSNLGDTHLDYLAGSIFERAAEDIEQPEVRIACAGAIIRLLHSFHYVPSYGSADFFKEMKKHDESQRIELASLILSDLDSSASDAGDVAFLINELEISVESQINLAFAENSNTSDAWERALRANWRTWREPASIEHLRVVAEESVTPVNRLRIETLIQDIEAQTKAESQTPNVSELRQKQSLQFNRQEIIDHTLSFAGDGFVNVWAHLSTNLNMDESSGYYTRVYELWETPGWIEAPTEKRASITDVALRFLIEGPTRYPDLDKVHWAADAYQAMLLLIHSRPDLAETIDGQSWSFWLPSLVHASAIHSGHSLLRKPLANARQRFPADILSGFRTSLEYFEYPITADVILSLFDSSLDIALQVQMFEFLKIHGLSEKAYLILLETLIRLNFQSAIDAAWVVLNEDNGTLSHLVGTTLLLYGNDENLASTLTIFRKWPDVGRASMLRLSNIDNMRSFPSQNLDPSLLADLYRLAVEYFPPERDVEPRLGEMHEINERELAPRMRDRFLYRLVSLDSWDAVGEIEKLISELPALQLPKRVYHDALYGALRSSWSGFEHPENVLQIVSDQRRRIIRSVDQLTDLVLEAFARLQYEIGHGAAADLWSEWNEGRTVKYRPKGELALSDYIKRFLDRDLDHYTVSSNREVENKRRSEVDLLVQYIDRGEDGAEAHKFSVIVEVKGCWHQDLTTAMENQLASKYLEGSEADHGVYLVVWFHKHLWDNDDSRIKSQTDSLESIRNLLAHQALQLSIAGKRIESFVLDSSWL